ncbi:MAG TPA: polyphosphate kinase 1, partial [Terriglobales bacterium]
MSSKSVAVRKAQGVAESAGKIVPIQSADLDHPALYINRELSLLAFQKRVLEEAVDPSNPLLERVRFLSIVGSNLDEFFMVRVAGLIRQMDAGTAEVGADGMTAREQLDAIRTDVARLVSAAQRCLHRQLLPALEREGIHFLAYSELNGRQRLKTDKYFSDVVFPVLTPLAFDPGRPFPHISNLSVNLAVLIRDSKGQEHFARVKVPDSLPQIIAVDRVVRKKAPVKSQAFIWIEDLIASNLQALFPGMEIVESHPFHLTRDADLEIQELEAGDLLETTEESLRQRRFGDVVRLQVGVGTPQHILKILISNLEVDRKDVYRLKGRLSTSRLRHLADIDRPDLKWPNFVGRVPASLENESEDEDIFAAIRRRDILLHHPFDSFTPVLDLLSKGAHDPAALAIKMTLYRVGRNSPVVRQLLEAIEEETQVAVLVELKARFDEESNIEWARALENQGGHVVYGLPGLKVHGKAALIVR